MSSHRQKKKVIEKLDNPFDSLDFDNDASDDFAFDEGILGSTAKLESVVDDCEQMANDDTEADVATKNAPTPSLADIFSKNSSVSLNFDDIADELEAAKPTEAVWDFSAFAKTSENALAEDNQFIENRTMEEHRRHAEYLEKKHATERDELKEKAAKLAVSHKQRRRKLDLMKKSDDYTEKMSARFGKKSSARKRLNKARNSY